MSTRAPRSRRAVLAELTQAQTELERTLASADAPTAMVALPIRQFQGELPLARRRQDRLAFRPRAGRPLRRFRSSEMASTSRSRKVAGARGARGAQSRLPRRSWASSTLVIIDHGGAAFTMYGYLSEAAVTTGMPVTRGAEIGKAGLSPTTGGPRCFECASTAAQSDPLQWLKAGG